MLKSTISFVFLFVACIVATFSCSSNKERRNQSVDENGVDSVYSRLLSIKLTNPMKVLAEIDSIQKNIITDSSTYYQLELLRADVLSNGANSTNKGIAAYKRTYDYCLRSGDKRLELMYWNYYGNYVVFNLGHRDSGLTCYKKAYNLLTELGDDNGLVSVGINLADSYRMVGDPARASYYYRKVLEWLDSVGSTDNLFNVYTGLGQTYAEIANYKEAERFFKLAGNMLDSVGVYDKFFYHNSYGNELYYSLKYDEAIQQFEQGAVYVNDLHHPSSSCIAATNLCEVNLAKGNIEAANEYLEQALSFLEQLPQEALLKFYIYSLAGDIALHENKLDVAEKYFNDAGDTSIIGPRDMALHYSRLNRLYAQLHDYAKAYHYLLRADYYDKLINNDRVRNQIAEIELRYRQDTTIMQQRLVIAGKENEVKMLEVQIFLVVMLALLVIAGLIIFSMYKHRRRIMNEVHLRQSLYAMRLANIRNRMSPHFVFNVLSRELKNDNPGINNLVKLLRTNLQLCDCFTVSLAEELGFVDTYIAVEAPSLGENFKYRKHIVDGIDLDKIIIPSMMVQIFVENAVKHGLRGYKGEKRLDVYVDNGDDAVIITVENEGNPISPIGKGDSTGTGMKVVTQTINLLNEKNVRKIDVNIKHELFNDGESSVYTVKITIPNKFDFSQMLG